MQKILNFIQEKKLASIIIILILTSLVYSNILSNEFVWDDPDFYGNWPALYSYNHVPELLAGELPEQHGGVYRPLRSLIQLGIVQSFGAQISIMGSSTVKSTFGYHLISLIIHLIGVVAVYFFIEILTKKRILAFLTALFFGLHPIHTEAITFLTTSIDVIGILFLLWSIYFYLKNQAVQKKLYYIISILLAWLAYFTYEMALVLPAILVLVDLFKNNFNWQEITKKIKGYIPFWIGIFTWLALRISLDIGQRNFPVAMEVNLFSRLLTVSKAIIKYIYLLFVPYPLNVYHDISLSFSLSEPKVILSVLIVLGLIISAIFLMKKRKIISFSIFWFFISLSPALNIFPTGTIMAEKYTYLASVSSCLILGWLIYLLLKKESQLLKSLGLIIILIIVIFYGYLTYSRNFDWKNNEALWSKTLEQRPDYGRVYNNLGFTYAKKFKFDEAIKYFNKAKELEPNLAVTYKNLGNIYDELGDYETAIANYEQAIELEGNIAENYNNLGVSYRNLGQLDKALKNYEKAIEVSPFYFIAYSNIGVVYLMQENYPMAQEYFEKTLELNPDFGQAHHGLAVSYVNQEKTDIAIKHYEKSMSLLPGITDNYSHLASIYQSDGDIQKAMEILSKGIQANPNSAELHTNLSILLANGDQFDQAIIGLRKALEIDPNYTQAIQILNQIAETTK